jgi:hypothetical protein
MKNSKLRKNVLGALSAMVVVLVMGVVAGCESTDEEEEAPTNEAYDEYDPNEGGAEIR